MSNVSNLAQMVDHEALAQIANYIRNEIHTQENPETREPGRPKHWWLYRRISDPRKQTAEQEGYQYQQAMEYINRLRQEHEPVETRMDGVSAYKTKFIDRPAAKEIINSARPGDELVAWSFDRFGRHMVSTVPAMEYMAWLGLAVNTVYPAMVWSVDSPMSRLFMNMAAAWAQWEAEQIGLRTSSAMQARKKLGLPMNAKPKIGHRRIWGPIYNADGTMRKSRGIIRFERDDREMALILQITNRYLRGEPLRWMLEDIIRRGIKPADPEIEEWTYRRLLRAIRLLIHEPEYYGADIALMLTANLDDDDENDTLMPSVSQVPAFQQG